MDIDESDYPRLTQEGVNEFIEKYKLPLPPVHLDDQIANVLFRMIGVQAEQIEKLNRIIAGEE